MRKFIDIFSSLKLTLALMLGLALLSIGGTLQAGPDGRFELYYQSLWFRGVFALFFVQLATCTVKIIGRNRRDAKTLLQAVAARSGPPAGAAVALGGAESVVVRAALVQHGYLLTAAEGDDVPLLARRGRLGRWGSTIAHLSCLLIIVGAFAAELGFVGTLNIYNGDSSTSCFDWDLNRDRQLGFTFRLDHFEPRYYPIELKFGEVNAAEKKVLREYVTREGETVQLSPPGVSAEVLTFSPDDQHLILGISRDGDYLGEYHLFSGGQKLDNRVEPGVDLRLLGWRDPLLRQLHSEVSILEGGQVVKQGVISVNHPLVHRGIAIYQTAYAKDDKGFWYAGFQFSRDPGEGLVWVASITFVIGLLCAFFVPYRAVGVRRDAGQLILEPLSGFRGEIGQDRLTALAARLVTGNPH